MGASAARGLAIQAEGAREQITVMMRMKEWY
jgi:hypothetical protein